MKCLAPTLAPQAFSITIKAIWVKRAGNVVSPGSEKLNWDCGWL